MYDRDRLDCLLEQPQENLIGSLPLAVARLLDAGLMPSLELDSQRLRVLADRILGWGPHRSSCFFEDSFLGFGEPLPLLAQPLSVQGCTEFLFGHAAVVSHEERVGVQFGALGHSHSRFLHLVRADDLYLFVV